MKKLQTRADKEKETRNKQLFIGGILIVLMVFGTFGYALTSRSGNNGNSENLEYKGIKFVKTGEVWNFEYMGRTFQTRYSPEEVKDISVPTTLTINDYKNQVLYVVGSRGYPFTEIAGNLLPDLRKIQPACLGECEEDFPEMECGAEKMLIIKEPKEGEGEEIYQENNCIFIVASFQNETQMADAYLYKVLEIN